MTQMLTARAGEITREIAYIAEDEMVTTEWLAAEVAAGRVAVPANKRRSLGAPRGVGNGLRVKVNANIGSSPDRYNREHELAKVRVAVEAGADAVMDLSTGGDIGELRRAILKECPVPLGTVPIYQAVCELIRGGARLQDMTLDFLLKVIEEQARDGVDFMTVHCGVTRESLGYLQRQGRTLGIVSRGGSFLAQWIRLTGQENPLYDHFDKLLDIALRYDVTLSLGDGLRPGCLADATDRGQIHELVVLGDLTKRAWQAGVQVMVEGPGHVPMDQIATNMRLQKSLCHGAPFYVLGPIVTDIAPGYDHITSAIGGAIAAHSGADFLCYVTRAEHLRLPDVDDVREGVITARIAAHAADIARGRTDAWKMDLDMAKARRDLDWERQAALALDRPKAEAMRAEAPPTDAEVCSMCGIYCAIKGLDHEKQPGGEQ
ncbi:phosphomethylpyrimidine synthase ThiC [bacterium]|nr:phosphomethylpyrimidine synthase ThiC [candidate division CSSED10-310 bacterium]